MKKESTKSVYILCIYTYKVYFCAFYIIYHMGILWVLYGYPMVRIVIYSCFHIKKLLNRQENRARACTCKKKEVHFSATVEKITKGTT